MQMSLDGRIIEECRVCASIVICKAFEIRAEQRIGNGLMRVKEDYEALQEVKVLLSKRFQVKAQPSQQRCPTHFVEIFLVFSRRASKESTSPCACPCVHAANSSCQSSYKNNQSVWMCRL